ncbi:hypothetical protein [Rhodobacter calidifons]|uniref:Outer membrane efflux protein n=1 Tax=Rhodobacter calidifons TaxID=2715277 RepID=A0ABX0G7C5_9RHOB|nr:hypothetical protein [Rhodobacter calidifons]NHB76651.1 hypothetical protein [Rhodobacter calidifons]
MNRHRDIARLAQLAQMVLDHRLLHLRRSAAQLDQSRAQLSAVNQAPHAVDLEPILSSKVGLDYERWADVRRSELNLVIARQTADWLDARDAARTAFGRVQALQALSSRKR